MKNRLKFYTVMMFFGVATCAQAQQSKNKDFGAKLKLPEESKFINKLSAQDSQLTRFSQTGAMSRALGGTSTTGGGGNSIVCSSTNGKETSELLDFVEARTLKRNNILKVNKSVPYKTILERVIARVNEISPGFAADLQQELEIFEQDVMFIDNSQFMTVADSNHISVPDNCIVMQTAIQRERKFPSDKKFFVNQEVWQTLPELDKAGLVSHEIIYSLIRKGSNPVSTSEGARYVNSWIFSEEFAQVGKLQFATFLLNAGFQSVKLDQADYYPSTYVSTGWIYRTNYEKLQPVKLDNASTLGNIQLDPRTGTLKALLRDSALKLRDIKLFVRYAEFLKTGEIYALAVVEESRSQVKSCWIRIKADKSFEYTKALDKPELYSITNDPVFLSAESCSTDEKTKRFETIKASLFSVLD